MLRSRRRLVSLFLCAALVGPGCDAAPGEAVKQPRLRTGPPPRLSSAERFGYKARSPLSWTLPPGWEELPATAMRLVNLRVAGHEEAECAVSVFPGAGGGLLENVNRWRAQMGQPPLEPAGLAQLPQRMLLGHPALLVELEGTWTGAGGHAHEHAGFRLVGLLLDNPSGLLTVKLTGPAELVARELGNFQAFCDSLQAVTR